MNLYSRSLLLLGVAIAQTYGVIYDRVSQLPTDIYDYIIVGGSFPTPYNLPKESGINSPTIIIRWDRWQRGRKPFDRRHQHPSPRPRGWWKVSYASVVRHARSPRLLSCSNQGVLASIIPLLFYTLSPDTVSPISRGRISLVYSRNSNTTGTTPRLRNPVLMAAASLTPGEGFWVDRAQSVSYSPMNHLYTIHTHSIHSDGMAYNTGSRDDWDHVSKITGDPAWTWDAMAQYRDLNQKYVPPNDGHDDVIQEQLYSLFPNSYHPSDKPIPPVGTQS